MKYPFYKIVTIRIIIVGLLIPNYELNLIQKNFLIWSLHGKNLNLQFKLRTPNKFGQFEIQLEYFK